MNTDKYEGHTLHTTTLHMDEADSNGSREMRLSDGGIVGWLIMDNYPKADINAKLIAAAPELLAEVKRLREELDVFDEAWMEQKKWLDAYHAKAEDMDMSDVVPSEEEVERLEKEGHWAYCYECFETNGLTDSCDDNRHTWIDEKRDE